MKLKKILFSLIILTADVSHLLSIGTSAGTLIRNGGDSGVVDICDQPGDTIVSRDAMGTTFYFTSHLSIVAVSTGYAISQLPSVSPQTLTSGTTRYVSFNFCNLANAADNFTISASTVSGENWSVKILKDDNSDGVRQSGENTEISTTDSLAADATFYFFVMVYVPSDAKGGDSSVISVVVKNQNGQGTEDNWPHAGNDTITANFKVGVQATIVDTVKPNPPSGIRTVIENGRVRILWSAVTLNTDGSQCNDLAGYKVYKSTQQRISQNLWTFKVALSSHTHSWLDNENNATIVYYRITAYDTSGNESEASMLIDSRPEAQLAAVLEESGKITASIEIPASAASILLGANNSMGADIVLKLARLKNEEKQGDISVIEFKPYRADTNTALPPKFKFSDAVVLKFYYDIDNDLIVDKIGIPVNTAEGKLAIFYHNGIEWVKYGGRNNKDDKSIEIKTSHLSKYKLSQSLSDKVQLTITPRKIFSPDDKNAEFNKIRFNIVNPYNERFVGKIFDINGAYVCDLNHEVGAADNPCILYWDGKDSRGRPVASGLYIYQIEGNKTINGVVVVAR